LAPRPCRRITVGAPGGPATSRTKVVPRPASSTWRPGGRGTGGANAASNVDSDDLHLQGAARRLVLDRVTSLAADQGGAEGRTRRDHSQVVAALLDRSRSEEHTSELQSRFDLVCRLLLEKKNNNH